MAKVYYNLPNDITDKSTHIGLSDILKRHGIVTYTEMGILKGEVIDIAYILYDETLLSRLADMKIKKISIFSKGDDNIFVPKNFARYSSDKMQSMSNTYNIILNNRNYKTENEIIMCGYDTIHQDIIRNIYAIYGNVITCSYSKFDINSLETSTRSRNIPNTDGMYYNTYAMLEGLKLCTIKKNIIKVGTNGNVSDLKPIITSIQSDKVAITNIDLKKIATLRYGIGGYIIAGKYDQLLTMFTNTFAILHDKVQSLRRKMRLEYAYEQLLVIGYTKDTFDFMHGLDPNYIKELMNKHFILVSVDDLGYYWIPYEKHTLTNFPNVQSDVYRQHCSVKSFDEL